MRILMITDSYPHNEKPYLTTFHHEHAKVLSRIGDVKVLTLIRGKRFGFRRYRWEGIEVEAFEMPYKAGAGFIFLPLAVVLHFLLMVKNSITFKPEVNILQMSLPHGIAYIPLGVFKIPRFILEHSTNVQKTYFKRLMVKLILKVIPTIYVVSSYHKSVLEKSIGIKIAGIIPNPIRDFAYLCKETSASSKIRRNRIAFVGSLIERKRPDLFIKAAKFLPNTEFILIGAGDISQFMPLPPNVKYLGALDHKKTIKVLCETDLLVTTSEYETFGVAIAEALALGKPVVWTDSGGPRDFLNERNSVLVKERTPQAVARAIEEAYKKLKEGYFDPDEIREGILRYAGVEAVEKKYRRAIEELLRG